MNKSLLKKVLSNTEMEEEKIKRQLNILEAMVESELEDYHTIQERSKREICQITGCEERDIDVIIRNFEQILTLHGWLRRTREKDLPLPKSPQEMKERFSNDRYKIKSYFHYKDKNTFWSHKDKKIVKKWGYNALKNIHVR